MYLRISFGSQTKNDCFHKYYKAIDLCNWEAMCLHEGQNRNLHII
jgi:hypothetical protein